MPRWGFSIVTTVAGPLTDPLSSNRKIFSHLSRCWIHFYGQCFYTRISLKFRQNSERWPVPAQYCDGWGEDGDATVCFATPRNCPAAADTAVDAEGTHKPQTLTWCLHLLPWALIKLSICGKALERDNHQILLFFQAKFPACEGKELGFSGSTIFFFCWVAGNSSQIQNTKFFSSGNHSYSLFWDTPIYRLSQNWSGAFAFNTIIFIIWIIHNEF